MFRNTGNRLHILCNRLHILCNRLHNFENVSSQVVTLEIWNLNVQNIGNQLHVHGNRLLLCKLVWKECWLLVIDYQRVKLLVRDFSLKNSLEQNCAIQSWKNLFILILMLFLKFLHILSLLLNLHLNLDSSLESWLFTWILILDWTTLWFLKLVLTLDSWLESLTSSK